MKIEIKYKTIYNYSTVVPKLIQSIKLHPTKCINQEIIKWNISINCGKLVESHIDGLGHKIHNIFNKNFSGQLEIEAQGVVKTKDLSGVMKGLKDKVHPFCFLRQTNLTNPCENILKISKKAEKKKNSPVDFVHRINLLVSESIKYKSGSTSNSTCVSQALKLGEGVCQDFAHIMISVARLNNLPARYINGFLLEDSNSGENSTHAWVEIFINDLGWVAFDPSHKRCIDENYVRISAGLDFFDASTIKGIKINYSGNEKLESKVLIRNCQ